MARLVSLVAAFLLALALVVPAHAAETGNGKIEGVAVNRTAGGTNVSNADVMLRSFQNTQLAGKKTVQTDSGGHFVFTDLPTRLNYSYQVTVTFQGVVYTSELLFFEEGKDTRLVQVPVYDATTDMAMIKVATAHTIIYIKRGTFTVKEYAAYVNSSDRTLVGAADNGGETLRFTLPAGASDIAGTLGFTKSYVTGTVEGFSDSAPFPPGMKEMSYTYTLKPGVAEYNFVRTIDYPTDSYDLLVQKDGVSISSPRLVSLGILDVQGAPFIHLAGQKFATGEQIPATLSGISSGFPGAAMLWIIAGLALVAAALAYILALRIRQSRLERVERLGRRKEKLLAELADLDEGFEKGIYSESDYRSLRREKKARLVRLMQRIGENGEESKPNAG